MTSFRTLLIAAVATGLLASPAYARAKKPVGPPPLPDIMESDWIKVDPDNLLVIDTSRGRVLAELYPQVAPLTVERIKTLTRQHFYDGLTFFRVIDGFMAQTGDPQNTGGGGSTLPNVPGEFMFPRGADFPIVPITQEGATMTGLSGAMSVGSQSDALMSVSASGKVKAWGMFCSGTLGMARADDPDSANSQFFLNRNPSPSLDRKYTAFGRVLTGIEYVRLIKAGEPVAAPQDRLIRVRLANDLPEGEKVALSRLNVESALYRRLTADMKDRKGSDFNICDMDVLTRPN
jgi:peptidylprolyl isomerase